MSLSYRNAGTTASDGTQRSQNQILRHLRRERLGGKIRLVDDASRSRRDIGRDTELVVLVGQIVAKYPQSAGVGGTGPFDLGIDLDDLSENLR